MKWLTSTRVGYLSGFLICAALLAYALYLQYYEYQDPCPLCILQRVIYIGLMILFLVGGLHGPRRTGAYVYTALQMLVAAIGIAVASRHVWLQHLPKDQVPQCGPGLSYMLDRFPLLQALDKVLHGSGECAEVSWRLLGLSIAEWSLVWFILLGALALAVALAARRPRRN